ncbi:SMP-30/gluconolactonase/LRE family protein [Sandaracinobacteroides saxicola]|uniref:SMP-30/gluconolactonase/LRE family protein n=1 Tax=Sandaracinobacteroides saxicola TaxID=2759707 RepID=A0A7G5IFP9_9SPHN|nr:SMP-30/gluconolactonase/LRE family protein [Sandaracinobacteroides saxicola]QMW22191.1 SMP-30/gluconolactonase/LRE family protein [Sandaracinobacteroides saxicola]
MLAEPFALFADLRLPLAECPVWHDGALHLADVRGGRILRLAADGGIAREWRFDDLVACFAPLPDGDWIVAGTKDICRFNPETALRWHIARLEDDLATSRLNDGRLGPDGAFWVASMDESPAKAPIGSLWRVPLDGTAPQARATGIVTGNGIAFAPDGRTLYAADSRGVWIDAWDFDRFTSETTNRRRIATPTDAQGRPDGAQVDAQGHYWSAGVSAACLNIYTSDGTLLERHPAPTPAPTMPAFGTDGFVYLTSLRRNDDDPHAGGVFRARLA